MEVVSIALETVRDLLVTETKFLRGVRNQVREIEKELGWIQAFLKEADKRQVTDERIRKCISEFRSLAYGIENVLDNFDIEVDSRRKGYGIKKVLKRYACIFEEFLALHKVGTEIEDIKTSLGNLGESFRKYGILPASSVDDDSNLPRQTYPDEIEECFVGMNNDIKALVSLITNDHENAPRVITIHGMGGLGKTTLARKIYNHNDVEKCFEAFAWVTVTQEFDEETILRDILKRLLPDSRKNSVIAMGKRDLVEELRKEQKTRKCLVVLDDMWETRQWNTLSSAFPLKGENSKVLITTRNKKLMDFGVSHPLDFLSVDDGWELLRMTVFGKNVLEEDAEEFEYIGKELVRKCGKLPLAISVLGGILRTRRSLDYWKEVSKDVDSYLTRSDKSDEEYGRTLQVLALSYNSLPYHLKPCFLHLGQFQEDEDIDVQKLYSMWMAEGMISSSHKRKEEDTLFDVAEMYLIEMANRSMVQLNADDVENYFSESIIVSCRLHDLWREFCLSYGEKVEFFKILDFRGEKAPVSRSLVNNPWRYSIYMDSDERREDMVNMALGGANGETRSFNLLNSSWSKTTCINLSVFQKFKFLRILLIEKFDFVDGVLPEGIKKLIHLRYLGLILCGLKKLPQWISKFQCLQTLNLQVKDTIEIPNCLWKLKQLRHLYLPEDWPKESKGKVKLSLRGLTNLETLVGFNDDIIEIEDLSEMINLRFFAGTLHRNKSLTQIVSYNNNHLHKLRKMFLILDYESTQDTDVVPLQEVFKCIGLLYFEIRYGACDFTKFEAPSTSNLIQLDLMHCKIRGDPMEALGNLSNLRVLKFWLSESLDEGFICENMFCDSKAFPKLRSLELSSLHSLKKWVVCEGAMPELSDLTIQECNGLEMIPDGFRFLTALKKLKLSMPKSFNDRVRVIDGKKGVDFDKVSHVPFIDLDDSDSVSSTEEEISEDGDDASEEELSERINCWSCKRIKRAAFK